MEDTIQKHILETEEVAINKTLFIIQNSKMIDLANNVSVPKSHGIALFKYQSTVSFVDFKKMIRTQKAIVLIEYGFLTNNTLVILAAITGFSFYSPILKSCNSITGSSLKEYLE